MKNAEIVMTDEKYQSYECPPVMICGFNRPHCLKRVFDAVRKAKPKQLFLVLDAPRVNRPDDVSGYNACRGVFEHVDWPCDVRRNYAETNMGCGLRMVSGISWTFEHVDRAIILEDDCVPEISFFQFCAELLERYKDDTRVGMIAGHDEHLHLSRINTYGDSYYFDRMTTIWGWATWRRAWAKFDYSMPIWPFMSTSGIMRSLFQRERYVRDWIRYSGTLYRKERNTWAGAWAYTMYKENWLSAHPSVNLISNIGSGISSRSAGGLDYSAHGNNPWFNRQTKAMEFPLKHPKTMIPNLRSEYYHMEDIHTPALWRKILKVPGRAMRKGLRVLKSIVPRSIKAQIGSTWRKYFCSYPDFCRKPSQVGICAPRHSPRIIVSLTSFPARIKHIYPTLWTLLRQDFKPDKVVLWLANEQFPRGEMDIPDKVLELKEFGLSIGWCEDIRSYKKLVPAIRMYPNDIIVTADDDIFYPKGWLGGLWEAHLKNPNAVEAYRVHRIRFDSKGELLPYLQGDGNPVDTNLAYANIATTGGGVLFPPNVWDRRVTDSNLFLRIAPTADDLWVWAMLVSAGTYVEGVPKDWVDCRWNYRASMLDALSSLNNGVKNINDIAMTAILKEFPEIKNILLSEHKAR